MDFQPMKIATNHASLAGHFPGNPVVPGVVVLDEILSAVGRFAGRPVQVTGLPSVKFLAPLAPGEEFEIVFEDRGAGRAGFEVHRGAEKIAEGVLTYEAARAE